MRRWLVPSKNPDDYTRRRGDAARKRNGYRVSAASCLAGAIVLTVISDDRSAAGALLATAILSAALSFTYKG